MTSKQHAVKNRDNCRKGSKNSDILSSHGRIELKGLIQRDDSIYVGYSQLSKEKEVLS